MKTKKIGMWAGCALFFAAILIGDRWLKNRVCATLAVGESAPLLPPLVRLTRAQNYGAAWSSFFGQRWFLVIVTTVGMAAIAWVLWRIVRHPLGVWSLTAVLAGGIGNLIDRVAFGCVTDYFDLMFMEYPVFNVADCFVVLGAIGAAIYYLAYYPKNDAANWEKRHGRKNSDGE